MRWCFEVPSTAEGLRAPVPGKFLSIPVITAYALVPDYTPAEMLVMVGEDSSVARWDGY